MTETRRRRGKGLGFKKKEGEECAERNHRFEAIVKAAAADMRFHLR
jgi:hypothetical protein